MEGRSNSNNNQLETYALIGEIFAAKKEAKKAKKILERVKKQRKGIVEEIKLQIK